MAGIYLHIPFCKSKCGYCGFYSLPSTKLKDKFLEALKQEIGQRADYLNGVTVGTIYFGGGTPSLLNVDEIRDLLKLISDHYDIAEDPEITLETNPDTLSLAYLEALHEIGINRLSIGIQSFFDNDLQYLGRKHDANHARQCLVWAKQAGFENLNIDLIYGLPTSNADQWNRNLDLFFEANIPHLSAYALTLEPNSILTKQIELGKAMPVSEDDALRDYEILCRRAAENGFLHYEISNFCRRGMHSKHNASYWFGTPYLGLGPSAHSFDGESRQWNFSSVEKYYNAFCHCEQSEAIQTTEMDCCIVPPRNDKDPRDMSEKEQLTPEQLYDEYVMLRLRTHWGIDLKWLKREMGERFSSYCEQQAQPLIQQGKLTQTREFLYLNDHQMLFADGVAEALFC
jgi:oxygen-independent coproporphyrinogen-3 oxidase